MRCALQAALFDQTLLVSERNDLCQVDQGPDLSFNLRVGLACQPTQAKILTQESNPLPCVVNG
jgi:hypothetical protein